MLRIHGRIKNQARILKQSITPIEIRYKEMRNERKTFLAPNEVLKIANKQGRA